MKRTWLLAAVLSWAPVAQAATYLVSETGTQTPPYDTVDNAFTDLVAAVANAPSPGDIVLVTNGNYTLKSTVQMNKSVIVTSVNGRAYTFVNGGYPATSNRCFYLSHASAVLDGFTITNGFTKGDLTASYGAGMRISGGTVKNCNILTNTTDYLGGGVYLTAGTLDNCWVARNRATGTGGKGAGVYVAGSIATARITNNCVIEFNTSGGEAGGVYINGGTLADSTINANASRSDSFGGGMTLYSSAFVNHCIISSNSSGYGGGVMAKSATTLTNCTIFKNTGGSQGGGVDIEGGLVTDCIIRNNTGGKGGGVSFRSSSVGRMVTSTVASNTSTGTGGGGIYFEVAAVASNCVINANTASSGLGGGAYFSTAGNLLNCTLFNNTTASPGAGAGGGVYMNNGSTLTVLRNCLVRNNTALNNGGGGVWAVSGKNLIENCTIVSNKVTTGQGGGVGIVNGNVLNCIVYSNKATTATYNNYSNAAAPAVVWTNSCTTPDVSAWGDGNVTDEPKFVSFVDKDYHLTNSPPSPCIDKGLNQDWMIGATDRDGNPRKDLKNDQVDMGCYEYPTVKRLVSTSFMVR